MADKDITWERIEPTVTSCVGWRNIVTKTFIMPDGKTDHWDVFEREGARFASILAVTTDKQVIVARMFRPGPEKILDELPGGIIEKDKDPETVARKELLEETGYAAGRLELIGTTHRDGYNNGVWYTYLATNCVPVSGDHHSGEPEFIETRLISIDELLKSVRAGNTMDAPTVLLAYERLLELQGKKIVKEG